MKMKSLGMVTAFLILLLSVSCGEKQVVPTGRFPEENIQVPVEGGNLHGTIMLPEKGENLTLAIIVAGSGPTDRNGNSVGAPENNSLKMVAEALAENGIASFRYDKRGIAASSSLVEKEADLIFSDYSDDIVTISNHLMETDDRFSRLVLIGHSEGALLAAVAANEIDDLDGLISVAGMGHSAYDTLKRQLEAQGGDIYERSLPILDSLKEGILVPQLPADLFMLFRPSVQPYLLSWFSYDPVQVMAGVTVPTLIVQGDNDIQVTVEDANLLHQAKPDAKLEIIPEMNHILKTAPRDREGNLQTYSDPVLKINEDFVKVIIDFIRGL
jgi:hypothetical protein